jgi:hypothetical protein
MGAQLYGANGLPINADTNGNLKSSLYDSNGNPMFGHSGANLPANVMGMNIGGINDGAFRTARFDRFGNIRTGVETLLFRDTIEGATINTLIWNNVLLTTFATPTQTATLGLLITGTTSTTLGAVSIYSTSKQFKKLQKVPLFGRSRMRMLWYANTMTEFGFHNATTATVQIPLGAFFRLSTTGTLIPVIVYNGSDIATGTDIMASVPGGIGSFITGYYTYEIIVDDDSVLFVVQDVSTGRSISEQVLNMPVTQAKMWNATHLPWTVRTLNVTAPATGPATWISDTYICLMDIMTNKPLGYSLAGLHHHTLADPLTYATNATYPASGTVYVVGTLSSTTPAIAGTKAAGAFNFVPSTSLNIDYHIAQHLVPAPYSFICTGIVVSSYILTVLTTTGPLILDWWLSTQNATVNTIGALKVPLGSHTYGTAAAAGTLGGNIQRTFSSPIACDGGKYMNLSMRFGGTAPTAAGAIAGLFALEGYYE